MDAGISSLETYEDIYDDDFFDDDAASVNGDDDDISRKDSGLSEEELVSRSSYNIPSTQPLSSTNAIEENPSFSTDYNASSDNLNEEVPSFATTEYTESSTNSILKNTASESVQKDTAESSLELTENDSSFISKRNVSFSTKPVSSYSYVSTNSCFTSDDTKSRSSILYKKSPLEAKKKKAKKNSKLSLRNSALSTTRMKVRFFI